MKAKARSKIYVLAMTAVMAALIAVVSPFAIPAGKVSFTLCTLILYTSPYILGWKRASAATLVYILIGMVGLPVFSNFRAGLGVLAGPTGGYILGYIPLVIISGLGIRFFPQNRVLQFLGMIAATAVLYTLGTVMFYAMMDTTWEAALLNCVLPFIPFDLGKMVIATALGPVLRERLIQAGIHPEG